MTALTYVLLSAGLAVALFVLCCFPRVAFATIALGFATLCAWAASDGAYLAATVLGLEAVTLGWIAFECVRTASAFAERCSARTPAYSKAASPQTAETSREAG